MVPIPVVNYLTNSDNDLTYSDKDSTVNDMADLIRASSLAGVSDLIEASGGDAATLFRAVGIDPVGPRGYDAFIPYSGLARLMNTAATTLGLADFGLRLSRYQDFAMFGPMSVLIRNAQTLDDALSGLIRYLHTYTPAVQAGIEKSGDTAAFAYEYRVRRMPSTAQLTELTTVIVLEMLRRISAEDFTPLRVLMTHSQISSDTTYREYLPCPVVFEASRNEIVFPSSALSKKIQGDEQAYALAEQYLGSQVDHDAVSGQVREIVGKLLPLGQADLNRVAGVLLIHPRTLQRRLQAEGTGFDEVLAEVRRSRTTELIAGTDLPMSVIARELGYSEQSSFARSCVQMFGRSPSALRRNAGQSLWT